MKLNRWAKARKEKTSRPMASRLGPDDIVRVSQEWPYPVWYRAGVQALREKVSLKDLTVRAVQAYLDRCGEKP